MSSPEKFTDSPVGAVTEPITSPLFIQEVLSHLPHRYPFLMIDRVISAEHGDAHALKNVSVNEPYFQGHFPGEPVMPGVLILEALAQTSMFALHGQVEKGAVGYLAGAEGFRLKRKVVPGDQLHLFAHLEFWRRGIGKTTCRAEVEGEIAAEVQILFAMAR